MSYDMIVPQPFTVTDDPRILGIESIPNIQTRIAELIDKYRKETIDIDDITWEEVDVEFETLFPTPDVSTDSDRHLQTPIDYPSETSIDDSTDSYSNS